MSTRCNLQIQDNIEGEHILYRHCDGMPDSAGNEIKNFLNDYVKNTNTTYNYEEISKGIIEQLGFEDEGKVAKDINYFYEIVVHPNTIFYTCWHVPVFGNYDIDSLEDYPDCEEFNKCNIRKETINKSTDDIVDSKELLKYVDRRNKFLDELLDEVELNGGISRDKIMNMLKVTYDQGYNYNRVDNI